MDIICCSGSGVFVKRSFLGLVLVEAGTLCVNGTYGVQRGDVGVQDVNTELFL